MSWHANFTPILLNWKYHIYSTFQNDTIHPFTQFTLSLVFQVQMKLVMAKCHTEIPASVRSNESNLLSYLCAFIVLYKSEKKQTVKVKPVYGLWIALILDLGVSCYAGTTKRACGKEVGETTEANLILQAEKKKSFLLNATKLHAKNVKKKRNIKSISLEIQLVLHFLSFFYHFALLTFMWF